jgi:hypothetical protein
MATFTQSNNKIGKVYLAGPMSGIKQFNYPAFHEAARVLREKGLEVISPAEMDTPEQQAHAMASVDGNVADSVAATKITWAQTLAKDVVVIGDVVTDVVTLPNWNKSRGARLEVTTAMIVGKPVYEYNGGDLKRMDAMVMNLGILGFPIDGKMSVTI